MIYPYTCACGRSRDIIKPLALIDREELCECGQVMVRCIAAPRVVGDYAGYSCPITGKWVEGRKAHKENLARHGCRVFEPGETKEFQRRKVKDEEAFLDKVGDTAVRVFETMPAEKQEAIVQGFEHGLDVAITRS